MIFVFLLADIIAVVIFIIKQIRLKDCIPYVFLAFINLYTIVDYIWYATNYSIDKISTNGINSLLISSSISIIVFSLCIMFTPKMQDQGKHISFDKGKRLFRLYVVVLPIALYFNSVSNWTTQSGTASQASLAALFRNLMLVLFVMILTNGEITRKQKVFCALSYVAICIISTYRTNLFIAIVAIVYSFPTIKRRLSFKQIAAIVLGVFVVLAVGSARNGVSIARLTYPIMMEGRLGSIGYFQAYDVISTYGRKGTEVLMLPASVFKYILGLINQGDGIKTLRDIVENAGVSYYPMGGFFFLSDAYLMGAIIGPIIYTIIIFIIYRLSLKKYYYNHSPLALIWLSSSFFIIKSELYVYVKLMIVLTLIYYIISVFQTRKLVIKRRKKISYNEIVTQE